MRPEVQKVVIRNTLNQGEYVFVALNTPPLVMSSRKLSDEEWIGVFHAIANHVGIPTERFRKDIMLKVFDRAFAWDKTEEQKEAEQLAVVAAEQAAVEKETKEPEFPWRLSAQPT